MIDIERISEEELDKCLTIGRVIHYDDAEELSNLIDLYITTGEKPCFEKNAIKVEENPLTQ